jgi:secernin
LCDTLWFLGQSSSVFAKNSDRPVAERQLLRSYPARDGGGLLDTQYLTIHDTGAMSVLLSQPDWLWGAEHGINSRHVAIGNEKVYGIDNPYDAEPGLIGMDLVRLGLERGRNAQEAIDVITSLLERHGQGGVGDSTSGEPYWSSFLVADPQTAWVLETCGRTWAARQVTNAAAISNRLTIRSDWHRASSDVAPGSDFDRWRDPGAATGHADKRLQASERFLSAVTNTEPSARKAVAHLRDHGTGPWGEPAGTDGVVEPPTELLADGTGVTVCMHVRGYVTTTASIVGELGTDLELPVHAFAAIGSPCASVYVPVAVPPATFSGCASVPAVLGDDEVAAQFAALRGFVEGRAGTLELVRDRLGLLESDLWEEAAGLGLEMAAWDGFSAQASDRLKSVLAALVHSLSDVSGNACDDGGARRT